jgi:hypothetical protein
MQQFAAGRAPHVEEASKAAADSDVRLAGARGDEADGLPRDERMD